MTLIILGVDQKGNPNAWYAKDATDFIEVAVDHYGLVYEQWDMEKASKRFGEFIPPDLEAILAETASVTEVNWGEEADNGQLYESLHAPSLVDVAMQAVFHGMKEGFVLSEEEAEAFIKGERIIVNSDDRGRSRVVVERVLRIAQNIAQSKVAEE